MKRDTFTGRIGFVLAAAGSAVGLGNIWRFPYLAAQYGGGIFLLVYLVLVLTVGIWLMSAEIAIGRKTGLSAVGAFKTLNSKYSFIGYLAALVPILVLPYYSVIGGWVTKYLVTFVSGGAAVSASDGFFAGFISSTFEPLVWFLIFLGVTAVAVFFGVEKGIEKVSKFLMPVLVLLAVFIAGFVVLQKGALEGVLYYLTPDFSRFSVKTVLAALGQMFYSMSVAMGIMITYGSYMKKDVSIATSAKQIALFDTGIAFVSGLMIVPAVFLFSGGSEQALRQGPGLMFETLPKVFQSMNGGAVIGAVFFVLVLFAALTSSISLMETIVSVLQDQMKMSRIRASVVTLLLSVALGVPSSLGFGLWKDIRIFGLQFLDFFDFISNSVIMPIVALLTALFVGYVIKPQTLLNEIERTSPLKSRGWFAITIRYFAPVCILLVLITSLLSAFGLFTI